MFRENLLISHEAKRSVPRAKASAIVSIANSIKSLNCWKVSRILLMAFLVVFPFQIRTLIFNMHYLPTGNFNEYGAFFIYLSDILLVVAFFFFALSHWPSLRSESQKDHELTYGYAPLTFCIALFSLFLIGGIIMAEEKILHFFYVFRFLELTLLYFLLVNNVLKRKEVLKLFLYGMIFQSFISLGQYMRQSSMGFGFLGEPNINSAMPGAAKLDIDGVKILRSYGTFPHPNVFAGAVAFSLLWAYYLFRKNVVLLLVVMGVLFMALLLTFSRSAFLAVIGGLLVFFSLSEEKVKFKNIVLFGSVLVLLVVVFNLESVLVERFLLGDDPNAGLERLQYLRASRDMFFDYPFGVGLGHFTLYLQDYSLVKLAPWFIQPVHNVYLLVVNEIGFLGGGMYAVLLGLLFYWLLRAGNVLRNNDRLFAYLLLAGLTIILVVNLFDHYFFTLYHGQVLFFIYLGLASSLLNKSLLPRKKS